MPNDSLKVELYDDARKVKVDDYEGLVGIDLPHHEIHEGNYYSATSVAATAIADNGRVAFYISTPAAARAHSMFLVASGGEALVYLFSGCTVSAKGTAMTAYNWNRVSSNVSGVSVWHTPVVAYSGITIFQTFLPGGTKQAALGSSQGSRQEIILAPGTKYLLAAYNVAGGAKRMSLGLDWYEED